jgi:hypothetical protein
VTHQQIDQRSLALARRIVAKIDGDASKEGLAKAAQTCARWLSRSNSSVYREWNGILARPWDEVRRVLLDESQEGTRLRQSSPFCSVLTPQERWQIYRSFADAT